MRDEYFEWLLGLIDDGRIAEYQKLLSYLDNTDFRILIENDNYRAEDGINLRSRHARGWDNRDSKQCSVLEMLVALSLRCEEEIMNDYTVGDRTATWFWGMIDNLGLTSMTDRRFNSLTVHDKVNRFLDRRYASNGDGGLFTVAKPRRDMRSVEIWYQMLWYLNDILR